MSSLASDAKNLKMSLLCRLAMKSLVAIMICLLAILVAGCSFIQDSDAEQDVQADLEKLSDQELVGLAEETESGQAIAGQATRMPSWSRVPSSEKSRFLVKEFSRRLQRYSISDEPAFVPKEDGTPQQGKDGSRSISDEPGFVPKKDE